MRVDPQPRPLAGFLAVFAGGALLIAAAVVAAVIAPGDPAEPEMVLAWAIVAAQALGAVLMIVGGTRMVIGKSPVGAVGGAVIELPVCLAYLLYVDAVVGREPPVTFDLLTLEAWGFTALVAGSLLTSASPALFRLVKRPG